MLENFKIMQNKFERIKKMGWIKEKGHGFRAAGYTFEELLGKEQDDFPLPDFDFIEIKTMNTHSKTNLHLFNLTPEGDDFFPIKRLLSEFGCPDKNDKAKKVFYRSFNSQNYTNIIYGRKGILIVNRDLQRVELLFIDNKNNEINLGIFWSFEKIKKRLDLKLQYLAIVRESSRIINNEGYYYYHTINYYKLKEFDNFIDLLEKGVIEITFKIGYFSTGRRAGEIHDHGTDFSININNVNLLYDEIKL